MRVANIGTGARFHVEIDGIDRTGPMSVPNTGGWQIWQTVTKTGLSLQRRAHVIRLVFDAGTAENSGVGNYNWLRLTAASASSTPYGGTPVALPGTVQAENFDEGASGVAYVDTTAGNTGGQYRTTDVDIESTTDTGGGYNVGRDPSRGVAEVLRHAWRARARTRWTCASRTSGRARGSTSRSTASIARGR